MWLLNGDILTQVLLLCLTARFFKEAPKLINGTKFFETL